MIMDDFTMKIVVAYGAAILFVISIFIIGSIRAKRRRPLEVQNIKMKPPGAIFNGLIQLFNFFQKEHRKYKRQRYSNQIIYELDLIARDAGRYIQDNFHGDYLINEQAGIIVENLAVCFSSLVSQIKEERKPSYLGYDFCPAVFKLMDTINECNCVNNPYDFETQIMTSLKRIYFSFYKNKKFDDTATNELRIDFINNASKLHKNIYYLDEYLEPLQTKWNKAENLKCVDRDYIMPVVTTKNLLRFCQKEMGKTKEIEDLINWISERIQNERFLEVCYRGLAFNKTIVKKTYQEINDFLTAKNVSIPGH